MRETLGSILLVIGFILVVGGAIATVAYFENKANDECRSHGGIMIEDVCMTSDSRRLEW